MFLLFHISKKLPSEKNLTLFEQHPFNLSNELTSHLQYNVGKESEAGPTKRKFWANQQNAINVKQKTKNWQNHLIDHLAYLISKLIFVVIKALGKNKVKNIRA